MCYPVCGMVHIKEPLLLIDKSSLCGGSGFPFSLSEWSLTVCLMPYNRKKNMLSASLNKNISFLRFKFCSCMCVMFCVCLSNRKLGRLENRVSRGFNRLAWNSKARGTRMRGFPALRDVNIARGEISSRRLIII